MARQTITRGLPSPIYRNEVNNSQHIDRGGVYINETQVPTSLSPGAGAIIFTGAIPTVTADTSLTPGAGSVVLTGSSPSVTIDAALTPGAAAIAITGFAPSVGTDTQFNPGTGTLVFQSFAPSVVAQISIVNAGGDYAQWEVPPFAPFGHRRIGDTSGIDLHARRAALLDDARREIGLLRDEDPPTPLLDDIIEQLADIEAIVAPPSPIPFDRVAYAAVMAETLRAELLAAETERRAWIERDNEDVLMLLAGAI